MTDPSLNTQKQRAADACRKHFGEPTWIAASPGRVNLIGEHVDYNDGLVLPIAIDRYTLMAATRTGEQHGPRVVLLSLDLNSQKSISLERPLVPVPGEWTNYVAGVIDGFQKRGYEIPSFAAVIHSMVPAGSGLSSSAALEVATATLLESMLGVRLDPFQKARLCQSAEHEFAGVPCGAMDQLASVFGLADQAMLIDCQSLHIVQTPLKLTDAVMLVVDSRVKHSLAQGEYAIRRQQCREALEVLGQTSFRQVTLADLESSSLETDSVLFRRARHVVTETARTISAARFLETGNLEAVGDLMYTSHLSMKVDYEISCPEIDDLVRIAQQIGREGGVFGSRMTGGGFGGCTISLIDRGRRVQIESSILEQYHAAWGIEPDVFVVRPSRGAYALDLL